MIEHENEHQRRLLEQYARTSAPRFGPFRSPDLLGLALKGDPATTRYGLDLAREEQRMAGPIQRVRPVIGGAGGPVAQQFIVMAENDDTIDVKPFDGNAPYGDRITIQKALGLRRFDYDGVFYNGYEFAYVDSRTRTATKLTDASTETQKITPDYLDLTNSALVGLKIIGGFNPDTEEVDFIDLNLAGRGWAKVIS